MKRPRKKRGFRKTSKGEETLAMALKLTIEADDPQLAAVREYGFAKEIGRRWRFDFAWPDNRLAVEVEGGSATNGRHVRPKGFREDCEKYNAAVLLGWRVLRYTTAMVMKDTGLVIDQIKTALHNKP